MAVIRPTRPKRHGPPAGSVPVAVIQALIDGQLDGGDVSFFQGTRPATAGTDPTDAQLLGTLVLDTPSAPLANLIDSSNITLNTLGGYVYVAGTAQWARFSSSDHAINYDCNIAAAIEGNTITVNTVTWLVAQSLIPTQIKASADATLVIRISGSMTVS